MFGFKKWRRNRLMKKPLTDSQKAILKKNVPHYNYLPTPLKQRLQGFIQVFLNEKRFEGCAGLTITEEIKISIAAQASILMLGVKDLSHFYDDLRSILVYPQKYVAKVKHHTNSFFVEEGFEWRQGEAWSHGYVILAWDEVQQGAYDIHDGENLVFHEFAHQLDYEYGATEQIEREDMEQSHFLSLAHIVGKEYHQFLEAIRNDKQTLIDAYGAENLAEFFAVLTELFFERPHKLKKKHPDLYAYLKEFYNQDPAKYLPT